MIRPLEDEDENAGDYDYGGGNANTCPETCTGKENEQGNNTSKSMFLRS